MPHKDRRGHCDSTKAVLHSRWLSTMKSGEGVEEEDTNSTTCSEPGEGSSNDQLGGGVQWAELSWFERVQSSPFPTSNSALMRLKAHICSNYQ